MKLYCRECGELLVEKSYNGFDEKTGKRLTHKVCPTGKCHHTGFNHISVSIIRRTFLDILTGTTRVKCKECGEEWHY